MVRSGFSGVAAAAALWATGPLFAQETAASGRSAGLCHHARPKPACSAFVLTNAGVYSGSTFTPVGYVGDNVGESAWTLRVLAEWGYMVNVGRRHAIGAACFASFDDFAGAEKNFAAGPAVHYRRWLHPPGSLDVALGMAVGNASIKRASLFGLVKWNPAHWIGVAVRPEVIRRAVAVGEDSTFTTVFTTRSRARLSFGLELGGLPGLVLTPLAFGTVGLVTLVRGAGN